MLASAIGSGGSLASPTRLGGLPHEMKPHRAIIPTFMHGKKIIMSERVTEKGGNRIKRALFPNVIYRFLYSRLLDMNVYCRITTTTLRQIDRRGGFDEYLLSVGEGRCDDANALLYKKMVEKAFEKQKAEIREQELNAVARQGSEYQKTLREFYNRFDRFKINPTQVRM